MKWGTHIAAGIFGVLIGIIGCALFIDKPPKVEVAVHHDEILGDKQYLDHRFDDETWIYEMDMSFIKREGFQIQQPDQIQGLVLQFDYLKGIEEQLTAKLLPLSPVPPKEGRTFFTLRFQMPIEYSPSQAATMKLESLYLRLSDGQLVRHFYPDIYIPTF